MEMPLTDSHLVVSNSNLKIIIWNAQISSARSAVDQRNWRISKRFISSMIFQEIDFIGIVEIDEILRRRTVCF